MTGDTSAVGAHAPTVTFKLATREAADTCSSPLACVPLVAARDWTCVHVLQLISPSTSIRKDSLSLWSYTNKEVLKPKINITAIQPFLLPPPKSYLRGVHFSPLGLPIKLLI